MRRVEGAADFAQYFVKKTADKNDSADVKDVMYGVTTGFGGSGEFLPPLFNSINFPFQRVHDQLPKTFLSYNKYSSKDFKPVSFLLI